VERAGRGARGTRASPRRSERREEAARVGEKVEMDEFGKTCARPNTGRTWRWTIGALGLGEDSDEELEEESDEESDGESHEESDRVVRNAIAQLEAGEKNVVRDAFAQLQAGKKNLW
jgi:hypothetical protein